MSKMKTFVADTLGDIRHWKTDVAFGLKPTMESLSDAEARILGLFRDEELDAGMVVFEIQKAVRNAKACQMRRADILQIVNEELDQ